MVPTRSAPLAAVAGAALQPTDPTGKPVRPSPAGKPGPWFATVLYREAAAAARALGQRYLYVGGKRVYVEVV